MTSRPVSRARALRRAFSRQWARVRKNPRLLPGFASKAWRVVRRGQLDKLIERDRMRTDWFSDYMAWASEHDNKTLLHLALLSEKVAALPRPPRFGLVIVDDSAGDASSRAAAKAALDAQVHPAHVRNTVSDEAAALTAMESLAARGDVDYVGIFGSGDTFAPDALAELALELAASTSTALVYVDHDALMSDGSRAHPDFKPSWDPYLFAQQPYLVGAPSHAATSWRRLCPASNRCRNGTCCGRWPKPPGRRPLPICRAFSSIARQPSGGRLFWPIPRTFISSATAYRRGTSRWHPRHGGCACRFPPRRLA